MNEVLRIDKLPASALDAAEAFWTKWLPQARALLAHSDNLVIVLEPASYDHDDWRRSASRDLAREATPKRVNIIAGGDEKRIESTLAYLHNASAVTGQYLPLSADN